MTRKLSICDLDVRGKRVLMRVDFNVPLDDKGQITDDSRIVAALPSIKYVLEHGGRLVLMSHLGRPKGQKTKELSLRPCAVRLASLLRQPVAMADDCVGAEAQAMADSLKPGALLLLENLRYHVGEEKPDQEPAFARQLSALGDLYVNDAFGTAHRAHASTATVAQFFPGRAAAGFLLQKEIEFLGEALRQPKRPFVAIVGGSKISSKLGVLKALFDKVDRLLIGGGMAYTFLKAQGVNIGDSIHEDDMLNEARRLLDAVAQRPDKQLLLPTDTVIANALSDVAETRVVPLQQGIPHGFQGVDIGPSTVERFRQALADAGTILWNGPLGVFEIEKFAKGTREVAKAVAASPAVSIVGGGDIVAAIRQMSLSNKITHISTGGGAALEYLEYGSLPGIDALSDKVASHA